jgi:hypothetical protein
MTRNFEQERKTILEVAKILSDAIRLELTIESGIDKISSPFPA